VYAYSPETKNGARLAIELLDYSLWDVMSRYGAIPMKPLLMIADQVLAGIEYVHRRGILWRDAKPQNIMMKDGRAVLIDFGLSMRWRSLEGDEHIAYGESDLFFGTPLYASARAMRGVQQSRRDDLESIGYVLLHMARGSLPWQDCGAGSARERWQGMMGMKSGLDAEELCVGLPPQFALFLEDVRSLGFEEEPAYASYRAMFREALVAMGGVNDDHFEWRAEDFHARPARPIVGKVGGKGGGRRGRVARRRRRAASAV
jgi:serine/threonine protein kinase